MFYIEKSCPMCLYGSVAFRKCSNDKTIILLCEECESIWLTPEGVDASSALAASQPDYLVPALEECSWALPLARWATMEEIIERGWGIHIAGEIPSSG